MTPATFIAALDAQVPIIAGIVRAVPAEYAALRPTPGDWSVLEVIDHLGYEEIEDSRPRLNAALHQPGVPVPSGDADGEPRYGERDVAAALERFLDARRRSLAWLRALHAPDWSKRIPRDGGGELRAGDLLAAWAMHDILHLRQLIELRHHPLAAEARPYSADYAGDW